MKRRTIPFGYEMKNGEIIPHAREAECVLQIFKLYHGGCGYKSIAKRLNAEDTPYLLDHAWDQNMVKRILENRVYLGAKGFPALISPAEFNEVSELQASKPRDTSPKQSADAQVSLYSLRPYTPTSKILRMTNEINRALERSPDQESIKRKIYECASEKYSAIEVIPNG